AGARGGSGQTTAGMSWPSERQSRAPLPLRGQRSVTAVNQQLIREYDPLQGAVNTGATSRNYLDVPIQGHEQQLDAKGWILLLDHRTQTPELGRVDRGLFRWILREVFAEYDLVRAAVAVIDQDDLPDLVQITGDADVVPECLVPRGKFLGERAQGSSRQDDVVVLVSESAPTHVPRRLVSQPIIHAAGAGLPCLPRRRARPCSGRAFPYPRRFHQRPGPSRIDAGRELSSSGASTTGPAGVQSPRSRCESAGPPAPPRSSWPPAGYRPGAFSGSASTEGSPSSPGECTSPEPRPGDWLRLARGRTGCFASTARSGRSRSRRSSSSDNRSRSYPRR